MSRPTILEWTRGIVEQSQLSPCKFVQELVAEDSRQRVVLGLRIVREHHADAHIIVIVGRSHAADFLPLLR